MIPEATPGELLDALERFDLELRHTPDWLGWEDRGPYKYAVLHDDRFYPAKAIIALATGTSAADFRGGRRALRYLTQRGFIVVNLEDTAPAHEDLLTHHITQLLDEHEPGSPLPADHALRWRFEQLAQLFFNRAELDLQNPPRDVRWDAGATTQRNLPWMAFAAHTPEPATPVLLLDADHSGVHLALLADFFDDVRRTALRSRATEALERLDNVPADFHTGEPALDLASPSREARTLAASCVIARRYDAAQLPSDAQLLDALDALCDAARQLAPHVPEEEGRELGRITDDFASALLRSNIDFGRQHDALVRRFVAALAAKPFVILTGLSGSGKTQIALRFGDWLGPGCCAVIAVRPDWTGPEALLGYEDALLPVEDGRRAWHVPEALAFMLHAAQHPERPHLLLLDEMNLAHVERYFADILSGMESSVPVLPHLALDARGYWRARPDAPARIPVPPNLFVVGTVNVDETTYMFSPKVLDRASTLELRVTTEDLATHYERPLPCKAGHPSRLEAFLELALDARFHIEQPAPHADALAEQLRTLHALLSEGGFEFGHRVFLEALRFAAYLASAGETSQAAALDALVMLKLLPRLHGTRQRLEPVVCALARFAWEHTWEPDSVLTGDALDFDPLLQRSGEPRLPMSYGKLRRMTRNLRAHQFASFAE